MTRIPSQANTSICPLLTQASSSPFALWDLNHTPLHTEIQSECFKTKPTFKCHRRIDRCSASFFLPLLLLLADFLFPFPLFFICFFFWLHFPSTMNTFSLFILLWPFYPLLPIFTFSFFFLRLPPFSPSLFFPLLLFFHSPFSFFLNLFFLHFSLLLIFKFLFFFAIMIMLKVKKYILVSFFSPFFPNSIFLLEL